MGSALGSALASFIQNEEKCRNQSYSVILNNIHRTITKKIERQQKITKAEEIQTTLYKIKLEIAKFRSEKNNKEDNVVKYFKSEQQKLAQEIFIEQMNLYGNSTKESQAFLRRKHGTQTAIGDDIAEEELAVLLSAAIKNMQAEELVVGGGNQNHATSIVKRFVKENTSQISQDIQALAKRHGKKLVDDKGKSLIHTTVAIRAGKTDISVPAEIKINMNANPLIQKVAQAMAGCNFSIKNYRSKDKNFEDKDFANSYLHFGEQGSNLFKAVTGGLYEFTTNEDLIEAIYNRGMNYLLGRTIKPDTSNYQQVYNHFSHLRIIYELKGSGIIDDSGKSMAVDFVIWNDPDTENIRVRDVNSLILKIINNENLKMGIFSEVRMSFNKFLS